MYEIITKEMLTPTICRMKVYAPRLAASALPGRFLIVRATENGERIPLTISDYDKQEGTITIVTQQIGESSSEIITFPFSCTCVIYCLLSAMGIPPKRTS